MATKIRPIVFKINEPEGFVMNASNAEYTRSSNNNVYVSWQSPTYPSAYNGNGKQYILVNNNDTIPEGLGVNQLMYSSVERNGGPDAISNTDMRKSGTSTGVLLNNVAVAGGYGTYFTWAFAKIGISVEEVQAYMANVTITIVDP